MTAPTSRRPTSRCCMPPAFSSLPCLCDRMSSPATHLLPCRVGLSCLAAVSLDSCVNASHRIVKTVECLCIRVFAYAVAGGAAIGPGPLQHPTAVPAAHDRRGYAHREAPGALESSSSSMHGYCVPCLLLAHMCEVPHDSMATHNNTKVRAANACHGAAVGGGLCEG